MTLADELARKIEAAAHHTRRIQALSRTRPHVFAEQKDAIARDLIKLASELRTTFGGTPARIVPGIRTIGGQDIRVE